MHQESELRRSGESIQRDPIVAERMNSLYTEPAPPSNQYPRRVFRQAGGRDVSRQSGHRSGDLGGAGSLLRPAPAKAADAGKGEEVTILRDEFGIPNVFAETDEARSSAPATPRPRKSFPNWRRSTDCPSPNRRPTPHDGVHTSAARRGDYGWPSVSGGRHCGLA